MSSSSNQNSGGSQQAQTASNVLSGEKSYRRIEFAITGDPIADFIAGIRALEASDYPNLPQITVSHLLRALSDIAKAQHEWETEGRRIEGERRREIAQLQSLGAGGPITVKAPDKTQPYWTSSGGPMPASFAENYPPLFDQHQMYEFRAKIEALRLQSLP